MKYTMIHVTKSGVSAIYPFLQKNYDDYFTNGGMHTIKCTNENNPIIVVRDVHSRFLSMFKYWKNGSHVFKRSKKFIEQNKNVTILDYIQFLKKNNTTKLNDEFTWDQHHANTADWLSENMSFKNLIVITYVPNLNDKIQKLLQNLNIPIQPNISVPIFNNSYINKADLDIYIKNKIYIDHFVLDYFKKDVEFINILNTQPELFKLII
jgi:hypothetical protein